MIMPYLFMSDVYPNIKIEGQICGPTEGALGIIGNNELSLII